MSDTIYNLIVQGHLKRASKIKTDFKVPDRRFWWLKVKALAQIKDWVNLEKFSKEKKSPIGYGPFVQVCLEANAIREAEKYIPKIQDVIERVEYFIQIGAYEDAFEHAKNSKNDKLLLQIRNKCNKPSLIDAIDQMLSSKS